MGREITLGLKTPNPGAGFGSFSRTFTVRHVMAAFTFPLDSLVHPHQIEVQEFSSYALVIDARPRTAFDEDHLPRAVNLPVEALAPPTEAATKNNEAAESTYLRAAQGPAKGLPYALVALVAGLSPDDRVLVYCHRGGLDSAVWAEPLRAAGWWVDVLPGGWPNYRRWVSAGLEILPRVLSFRVLQAPPISGVDQVLATLERQGQQVLDLVGLTGQQLVPGVVSPAEPGASQAAFESGVLHALRRCEPKRDIWVNELVVDDTDILAIPPSLGERLRRAPAVRVTVPLAQRLRAWQQSLNAVGADLGRVVTALSALAMPPTKAMTAHWRVLAGSSGVGAAMSAIVEEFIDLRYDELVTVCGGRQTEGSLAIDSLAPLRGRAPDNAPALQALFATRSH